MPDRKKIIVQRTATFHTAGNPSTATDLWLVLHGYGQLSEFFIRKFSCLDNGSTYIVAPEALSRFYLEGFSGRVGATWMTKQEREDDINDYIFYLDTLLQKIAREVNLSSLRINLLGFSQGAPTLYRWISKSKIQFNRLIFWSGIFPPDMNTDGISETEFQSLFSEKAIYIVYGTKDPFLKEEHQEQLGQWKKLFPGVQILLFEGGHQIDEGTLKKIIADK